MAQVGQTLPDLDELRRRRERRGERAFKFATMPRIYKPPGIVIGRVIEAARAVRHLPNTNHWLAHCRSLYLENPSVPPHIPLPLRPAPLPVLLNDSVLLMERPEIRKARRALSLSRSPRRRIEKRISRADNSHCASRFAH